MTKLVWDLEGTRTYEAGVDRGVLYLRDNSGVAWNGLTSVQEDLADDINEPLYLDGTKVRDIPIIGTFGATLKAITYPSEFLEYQGFFVQEQGLYVDDQPAQPFGLCYRTLIGSDLKGIDYGYRLHILYNLIATNDDNDFQTITDQTNPMDFSWKLDAVPTVFSTYRPTAHITLETPRMLTGRLASVENILYGTSSTSPRLPSMQELFDIMKP